MKGKHNTDTGSIGAVLAFLALALAALIPASTSAAVISVTPGAVDMVTNGNCSIREAIVAANTDSHVDLCPAGSGADTINAFGTFVLTETDNDANGLPVISSTITINGATIRRAPGAPAFRIVSVASTGDLTLNEVTVSGGLAVDCPYLSGTVCGGIVNEGTLNVNSSRIGGNAVATNMGDAEGGGIATTGTVTVQSSEVSGNSATSTTSDFSVVSGGGIANRGTLNINSSRIGGNTASCSGSACIAIGGGMGFFGTVNVINSQVVGNTASCSTSGCIAIGGGLDNCCDGTLNVNKKSRVANNTVSAPKGFAGGGGLHNNSGTATLTNSAVARNTASGATAVGGGILYEDGASVVLNHTRVTRNTPDNCEPAIGACT